MESLSLTSGALYSHFSGKDELLALSIEKQIDSLTDFVSALIEKDKKDGFRNWIKYYLSEEHVEIYQMDVSLPLFLQMLHEDLRR